MHRHLRIVFLVMILQIGFICSVSATLQVSPLIVNFGSVQFGSAPRQNVGIVNNYSFLISVTIDSLPTNTEFKISNPCNTALQPGGICSLMITFQPSAIGSQVLTVWINSRNPNTGTALDRIPLEVNGQGVFPASTVSVINIYKTGSGGGAIKSNEAIPIIDCGSTCSGNYQPGTMVSLNATPDANSIFTGWEFPCTSAGGSCDLTANTTHISVYAGFKLKPGIFSSTASLDFTKKLTFTVFNTGSQASVLPVVTIVGQNPGDFTATGCGSAIPAGGTCSITVTFSPHQSVASRFHGNVVPRRATVKVDAASIGSVSVNVSGTP